MFNLIHTERKGFLGIGAVLIFVFIIIAGIMISQSITNEEYIFPLVVLSGVCVGVIAFVNTDWALIILLFSMLLSPEIALREMPERTISIRLDDIFIVFIFFVWLVKMAMHKDLGLLKKTPINLPVIFYVFLLIFSTFRGMSAGIVRPVASFLFMLKYIEYIMIFFLVANNIRDLKQIKKLVLFLILVYLIVSFNAIYQVFSSGFGQRAVCAPFDAEGHPEPNTLAGYLMLLMGINLGLFLYSDTVKKRLLFFGAFAIALLPFLWSFSRGAWLGFVFMYLFLMFASKREKIPLSISFVAAVALLPHILPRQVIARILYTFAFGYGTRGGYGVETKLLGSRLIVDTSSFARLSAWWYQISKLFPLYPLLGRGATGVGLTDSQYFRILGEGGIFGMVIFIWFMVSIFRLALRNFKTIDDNWVKGLSLGFLAGFVGLLVQGLTANVFIIIRIMEPFMFMTAIMATLPELFAKPEPVSYNDIT